MKAMRSMFSKRWHPQSGKSEYEITFAVDAWKSFTPQEKQYHSLEQCKQCYTDFYNVQSIFPAKPIYMATCNIVTVNKPVEMKEKSFIEVAVQSLNEVCQKEFHHNFIDSLLSCQPGIELQKTKSEKKAERRKIMKQCRDACNKELEITTPVTLLRENDSLSGYARKRLSQYFEKPPSAKRRRQQSHAPSFANVTWDKQKVLDDLSIAVTEKKKIIWTKFASEHGVQGKNCGQVVKEFATLNGIDTEALDARKQPPRIRSMKKRLPGKEISIPMPPTPSLIKDTWRKTVESGEIHLGEPCSLQKLPKYSITDGNVEMVEVSVEGRKIGMHDIRQRLLKQQIQYMHLFSDEKIDGMNYDSLHALVKQHKPLQDDNSYTIDELREMLCCLQRTRLLVFWHDHATILGHGYIMVTVHTVYDPAVYLTGDLRTTSIRTIVEQPHLYLIALNSSSVEDQAAIIPDRVSCLPDLNDPVVTESGIAVHDVIRFFIGDHPAQQFERGTQVGGHYKCGGCGCKSNMMQIKHIPCTARQGH